MIMMAFLLHTFMIHVLHWFMMGMMAIMTQDKFHEKIGMVS
jgi:hypothetical protein